MSKIPSSINKMIETRMKKGYNAKRIADEVNTSKTAKKLSVSYGYRSVAAAMANISRKTII